MRPDQRYAQPEIELRGRALGMRGDEPLQLVEAAVRPARERELRSAPAASGSGRRSRRPAAPCRCSGGSRPARGPAPARSPRTPNSRKSGGRPCRGFVDGAGRGRALPARLEERDPDGSGHRKTGGDRDDRRRHARARRVMPRQPSQAASAAILRKVMPNYRELLQQVRSEIEEVDAARARELLESDDPPLFLDVREEDEWNEGQIPGAVHIPRGYLESRVEAAAPDHARPIVIYCSAGNRSAFGAKTLDRARLRERRLALRRLHRLEAQRLPDEAPPHARPGEARAVQPPPAHSRGRRRGPAEAARVARAPDRRGRARQSCRPLPRSRRRRSHRHRRRRPRRLLEPAAPDRALDRAGSASGRPTRRSRRSRRSTRTSRS